MYYINKCIQKPTVKIHFMTQFAEFKSKHKRKPNKNLAMFLNNHF